MTDRKEILNFEHTHQELVDAIGNVAKVKNSEIALIAKKYAELEAKNARLRSALELIAFLDEPLADTIEYWNLLDCGRFAETLCNDTYIAREALKDN